MSACDSMQELLPLAVAGVLEAGEERRVRQHARECPGCAAELEELRMVAETLGQLPCEGPSPELLVRTQALAMAELSRSSDRRWGDVLMGASAILGWAATLVVWSIWRVAGGGESNWTNAAVWLGATAVIGWMTAGAAVVMLGRHVRIGRNSL
jgi:hypothetical protein